MKLSIIAMQALEYGIQQKSLNLVPWYRGDLQMFSPQFLSLQDDGEPKIWENARQGFNEGLRELTAPFRPSLFYWFRDNLSDQRIDFHGDSQSLLKIVQHHLIPDSKKDEASMVQTRLGKVYEYPVSKLTVTVKYENGLVLEAVELTSDEYDLVGFERN